MVRDAQHTATYATAPRVRRASRIQSVDRAAAILRAVAAAHGPAAATPAIAETLGLNRTTTWRILTTLEHQRLVALDRDTGWWSLGFGLIDLARQADGASMAGSARAALRQVASRSGETAALAVLSDGALTYVAEVSAGSVVSAGWQGRQVSMHGTSTGKVLLAFSDPAELRALLNLAPGGRLPRHTATTITSMAVLEDELELTRTQGYAVCRGEFESSAWGVSAPVLDVTGRPVAVVSIWGPSERLTEARFADLGAIARAGAAEIEGRRAAAAAPVGSS